MDLALDGIAVEADGGDFAATVATVKEATSLPLILLSQDPTTAEAGLKAAQGVVSLLWAATPDNWQAMAKLASSNTRYHWWCG